MSKIDRELPPGWEWSTIGALTHNHDGRRVPVKSSDRSVRQGLYPYYGASGVIDHVDDFLFEDEHLLVAEDGANLLSRSTPIAFKATGRFWVNNHAHVVTTKAGIPLSYLEHFLNSLNLQFYVTGSAQPKLTQAAMNGIPVRVAPLAEQHRIIAEIDKQFSRIDVGVAALKRLQAGLKRYRTSVLKAACEGKLVPTEAELARAEGREYEPADTLLARVLEERRARWEAEQLASMRAKGALPRDDRWKKTYTEPPQLDSNELPRLPVGWLWTTIDVLTVSGPQNGLYLPKSAYGSGSPILRIDDFQIGHGRSSDELRRVRASGAQVSEYSLDERDVVINRVNSPSHLGKCLVALPRHLPAIFESNMMRLQLASAVNPHYVGAYLWSHDGRSRLTKDAKWAVNQASINQGDVLRTAVPLPPTAEQGHIVEELQRRFSAIDDVDQTIAINLARAARLRQAVLKRAFEGKLVPQDPNDEPASALLERIRAERAAAPDGNGRARKSRAARAMLRPEATAGEHDDG